MRIPILFLMLCCSSVWGKEIHIDPNITEINNLINAMSVGEEDTRIVLGAGIYRLKETITIRNLGLNGAGTEIVGPEIGNATLSGAIKINNFAPITDRLVLSRLSKEAREKVFVANLKELGIHINNDFARQGIGVSKAKGPNEIIYRGEPMRLAQWPNNGGATIKKVSADGKKITLSSIPERNWSSHNAVFASGYWNYFWAYESVLLKGINRASGEIEIAGHGPEFGIKAGRFIELKNILEELDEPGEWYIDESTQRLYFWPPSPLAKDDVELTLVDDIVRIENSNNVTIKNLNLENARGSALYIKGGANNLASGLKIKNTGSHAAKISGKNNGIVNSTIRNAGEAGVFLSSGDRINLIPGKLYVRSSEIIGFGRLAHTYQPGVMLEGVGNMVLDTKIHDGAHSAIIFKGNDHLVSGNEIYRVCLETGDAGAIYTGRDWTARGTTISLNHIHDIPSNESIEGTRGIYLDDQASGVTIFRNVFENVPRAVYIGGGRDNLIVENRFIKSKPAIYLDARGKSWQRADSEKDNGVFRTRLRAVPYSREAYKKYIHLADILNDDPGAPKYNEIKNNYISDGPVLFARDGAEKGAVLEGNNGG